MHILAHTQTHTFLYIYLKKATEHCVHRIQYLSTSGVNSRRKRRMKEKKLDDLRWMLIMCRIDIDYHIFYPKPTKCVMFFVSFSTVRMLHCRVIRRKRDGRFVMEFLLHLIFIAIGYKMQHQQQQYKFFSATCIECCYQCSNQNYGQILPTAFIDRHGCSYII